MSTVDPIVRRRSRLHPGPLILSMIGVILAAGCAAGGGTVNVTLSEFSITPDKTEIAAGSVTFEVSNSGPNDIHEFVVVKTDLDPGSLPTDSTGTVVEAGGGMTVEGEIEDITVGSSGSLTLDLAAGKYVLICNIYDPDELEAHYSEGMRAAFTVN